MKKRLKYTVWYEDGKAVQVERCGEASTGRQSKEESDDGTVTKTGGETSEFEPSPVKHPRIESVV